jgi:hypothetical protein
VVVDEPVQLVEAAVVERLFCLADLALEDGCTALPATTHRMTHLA